MHNMTDPQLANAMSPQHHHEAYSSDTSNGTDQALDDAPLVSNFSPGRQSRTGSDESGSDAGPSSRANGANKGERSDRDSFQPQNLPGTQHLGIGEKSVSKLLLLWLSVQLFSSLYISFADLRTFDYSLLFRLTIVFLKLLNSINWTLASFRTK